MSNDICYDLNHFSVIVFDEGYRYVTSRVKHRKNYISHKLSSIYPIYEG